MLEDDNYSSDTSDEDFVPGEADIEKDLSEEDSDGCVEEDQDDSEAVSRKRKRKTTKEKPNKKINPLLAELGEKEDKSSINTNEDKKEIEKEKEKEKAKNLFASFLAEVDEKPVVATKPKSRSWAALLGQKKPEKSEPVKLQTEVAKPKPQVTTKPSTVKVTKVFEFAGEEVRLTEDVAADSVTPTTSQPKQEGLPLKKPSSGAASLLSMLDSKKKKLSVLEKTKMDWNSFKSDEGLTDELELHKKSKSGYLEKQAFLERADVRQFEIEKSMREANRSKR